SYDPSTQRERPLTARILALDLERTLIDDAMSGRPRHGLFDFLSFCQVRFERLALFTCVERPDAWEGLTPRSAHGPGPADFLRRLEYVQWSGEYKDLRFIPDSQPAEAILIDDDPGWVRPEQREWFVAVAAWDGGEDHELLRVRAVLESRTRARPARD